MRKIDEIIIHCSASTFGNMHRVRNWHTSAPRNWSDIGYHYVINNGKVFQADRVGEHIEDGLIEVGRPIEKAGAHCKGHNSNSIGICMIGTDEFSEAQYRSLTQLLIGLMNQYDIDIKNIKGHNHYNKHKTCPNFNVNDFIEEFILKENK